MAAARDVAAINTSDHALDGVVEQLCGELLLRTVPTAQPPIMAGLRVGLELFDLLLNPDHVVRTTETLCLKNALTLERQVEIDVSLDRLSRQQEHGAAQLATFMGERIRNERGAWGEGSARLWMPLLTLPRPFVPPVDVTDDHGCLLPRPSQPDVRRPLEAALYHLFRSALLEHPEFGQPDSWLTELTVHDHPGRWLLQAALLDLGEAGRNSPRSLLRSEALSNRLALSTSDGRSALPALVLEETDRHRRNALHAVLEVIAVNRPLLELLDLVHSGYVVVAGVESSRRHQRLTCTTPDVSARGSSAVRGFWAQNWRTFDPREHNFTIQVTVPVPINVSLYRLQLRAATKPDAPPLSVSLVSATRFAAHPMNAALGTIDKCAQMLGGAPAQARTPKPEENQPAPRVQYLVTEGLAALDALEHLTHEQERTAQELGPGGSGRASVTLSRAIRRSTSAAVQARAQIAHAKRELLALSSQVSRSAADVAQAQGALRHVRATFETAVMRTELVVQELPGTKVGRVHVNQPEPPAPRDSRPRSLEVWATFGDENHPYAPSALVPPLAVAGLLYLVGAFLFNHPLWWLPSRVDVDAVAADMASTHPGPLVSLLLLVPAFALSRLQWTDRRDVALLLRRPARLLVATAVTALCLAAVVLATQLAPSSPSTSDVLWVIGTLVAALSIFVAWVAWSILACLQRRRCLSRPKGLSRLFRPDLPYPANAGVSAWRARVRQLYSYDHRSPDAVFDLERTARPSTPGREA